MQEQYESLYKRQEVAVTDISMPFWSMVAFMIKWAVAAIPAMILLSILGFILFVVATAVLAGIGSLAR